MNMSCESIENMLAAFIDNELSENDKQRVGAHLKTCTACRELLAELKETNELIMSAADYSDQAIDFDKMWENIQAQVDFLPTFSDRLRGRWEQFKERLKLPAVWIPSAIGAVAAVLVIIFLPMHIGKKPTLVSSVEEVNAGSGQVLMLKTAASGQPLIWYQPEKTSEKEAG
ncbi:anti-sigma factor family protein [Desulfosarcina ovata]|uniref:Putative zinc-finger domain-containing protein n=1 Tax=Desulfosarcina ovata subsp. ovata TaxID=2752305 RepID=A0A5K8A5X2_9BACT|nr:zf-HC2 domain-containing protein [Desulfosarcina ovata]BBO88013.1 hypothetical protein DSCOOX_11930 [Desulfosarcina ovata subsp. ovata]